MQTANTGFYPDVFPYQEIIGDETRTLANGRTFRFLTYNRIAFEDEPRATALLDVDYQLVLVEGLYSDAPSAADLLAHTQQLAQLDYDGLAQFVNTHPASQQKLQADGRVAW